MPARHRVIGHIVWIAMVTSVALVVGRAPTAHACTCAPSPLPVDVALREAEAVLAGRVIESNSEGTFAVAVFRVDIWWKGKGNLTEITSIRANPEVGGMCGILLETGKSYIVYAYTWPGLEHLYPLTISCDRTKEYSLSEASALDEFAARQVPAPPFRRWIPLVGSPALLSHAQYSLGESQ